MTLTALKQEIFDIRSADRFDALCLEVFRYQAAHCSVYARYLQLLETDVDAVTRPDQIPALPIRFFKTQKIISNPLLPAADPASDRIREEILFTSSATTGMVPSRHFVLEASLYETSFLKGFRQFYGDPQQYVILALLPSYLEREGSSLVYMADRLIRLSAGRSGGSQGASGRLHTDPSANPSTRLSGNLSGNSPDVFPVNSSSDAPGGPASNASQETPSSENASAGSGFYLYDHRKLYDTLVRLRDQKKKTLLLGVSFALLDFIAEYPIRFPDLIVMETGGMKGRGKELSRDELHRMLSRGFGTSGIHSEYGMAELLSQAYSQGGGRFLTPPWMRIYIRDHYDPFRYLAPESRSGVKGGINIVDLANINSCSFIETEDAGTLYPDGSFSVDGRLREAELRGCNLLLEDA